MASSNHDGAPALEALAELLESLSGSLIEIYVFHTDRAGWERVLRVLLRHAANFELIVDGRHVDAAHISDVLFDDRSTRVMRALIGGAEWTSTLFREDQVDLQMDPDDFVSTEALVQLLGLLQSVADAAGHASVLIPETAYPESATPLASAAPR